MLNKIHILLIIIFFAIHHFVAGEDKHSCRIYDAYLSGNMEDWKDVMLGLNSQYLQQQSDDVLYDLILTQYGYTGYLIGLDKFEEANRLIEKGESNAERLLKSKKYQSEAYAMMGAFTAFKIAIDKTKAYKLGFKSLRYINQAYELDKMNPAALIEKGNTKYYMPPFLGGGYAEAADYYQQAAHAIEKNKNKNCNWLYLSALTWAAKSYQEDKQYQKADKTYRIILKKAPGFKWVKDELYPEFKKITQ
jgi:tetratricopeptide (TPR) repeat protein